MADVVVVNKIDSAAPEAVERVLRNVTALNPKAPVVRAASPVTLDPGPELNGKRVLAVEDGPTLTHGGMAFGAATVAARNAGAAAHGWAIAPDGAGFRRVVASPEPLRIIELATIRLLIDAGLLVVCTGGGGIPVAIADGGRAKAPLLG